MRPDYAASSVSNSSNIKYKKNGIVNGARGYVDSIQLDLSNPDLAEAIWIRFTDDNIGQLLRQDSKDLLLCHKPNHPLSVPIKKQKKQFQIHSFVYSAHVTYSLLFSTWVTLWMITGGRGPLGSRMFKVAGLSVMDYFVVFSVQCLILPTRRNL